MLDGSLSGALDYPIDETTDTVVHHWIVTGEPGQIGGSDYRYPPYRFVWSSADSRWPGEKAETEARRFITRIIETIPPGSGRWESGPFLHHRTVTYGPLQQVT